MAHEPLRVTLDDLRSAESKGKWWLVGAAWGGDPLVDRQNVPKAETDHVSAEDKKRDDLLKLARSQGMNTDIRRSIFVVLISSDVSFSHLYSRPCLLTFRRTSWTRASGSRN